jgi:hypothetical protein
MSAPYDPLAIPKRYWQGYGWLFGYNPMFSRTEIDAIHFAFLAQSTALRPINPWLADISEQMAAEFYGAALDALTRRAPARG